MITFAFATTVRNLNHQGLTIADIALRLRSSEGDVRWAHQVHNVLPVGAIELLPGPTQAERDAIIDRAPKKMQDRMRRPK